MDDVCQFAYCSILVHESCHLLNDVRRMCAISVATENASVLWSDEQLNHAVRGIHSESLTVGTIESLAAYVFCAGILKVVLTLADACCLGSCEDC